MTHTSLSQRLKIFMAVKELHQKDLAEIFGITPQAVSSIITGEVESVKGKYVQLLSKKFSDLNKEWLLTGEGEMLLDKKTDSKSIEPWKDEAYLNLKKENEYLRTAYDRLMHLFTTAISNPGQLGKSEQFSKLRLGFLHNSVGVVGELRVAS